MHHHPPASDSPSVPVQKNALKVGSLTLQAGWWPNENTARGTIKVRSRFEVRRIFRQHPRCQNNILAFSAFSKVAASVVQKRVLFPNHWTKKDSAEEEGKGSFFPPPTIQFPNFFHFSFCDQWDPVMRSLDDNTLKMTLKFEFSSSIPCRCNSTASIFPYVFFCVVAKSLPVQTEWNRWSVGVPPPTRAIQGPSAFLRTFFALRNGRFFREWRNCSREGI